jgi:hypothetical protein
MVTALEIGAALVLTPTLLMLAAALAAYELGCLVTRDGDQWGSEAGAPRDALRCGARGRRAAQPVLMAAVLALVALLGGARLVRAYDAADCQRACVLDLRACQNGCLDSRDFDGCLEDCHSIEDDCLGTCRLAI